MGLYNTVKVFVPCPKCGTSIGDFQTKDEIYDDLYLELVEFWTVREFHSICDNCDTWISVKLKKEKLMSLTLDDYDIIARPLGEFKEVKLDEKPK
jgi:hypothetical protein